MRGSLVSVGFTLAMMACGRPAPQPPERKLASVAPPPSLGPVPRVRARACRAEPQTLYGQEPLVFQIQADGSGEVDVELLDERGRRVVKGSVAAPGSYRPEPVPSGDFTLRVGSGEVTCPVTVNRELSRASQPAR